MYLTVRKSLFIMLISSIVCGCSISYVGDQKMVISDDFTISSTAYPLNQRNRSWFDKDLEKSMGRYQVKGVTSPLFSKYNEEEVDSQFIEFNLGTLLGGERMFHSSETTEETIENHFSFSLVDQLAGNESALPTLKSYCLTKRQFTTRTTTAVFQDSNELDEDKYQVYAGLSCAIKRDINGYDDTAWTLAITKSLGEQQLILTGGDKKYVINREFQSLNEKQFVGQQQSITEVSYNRDLVGLRIFDENKQIATLSLLNGKEIRISNELSEQEHAYLLTTLYSIIVFDSKTPVWWRSYGYDVGRSRSAI